jgi:hypothetical protein
MAKKKKSKSDKYTEKLKINGTLDEVLEKSAEKDKKS